MNIFLAAMLFIMVWSMTFFVVLPLRLETQGDAGEVVPGTHESAPSSPVIWRKIKVTTVAALLIWGTITAVILTGTVTLADIDWMGILQEDPLPAG